MPANVTDRFRLDGKVAILTGVGPGNGRDFALTLAAAGADVCLVARSRDNIEAIAEEVRALGRRALAVAADMTVSAEVEAMVARTRDELGRIDILFNHAGGGRAGGGPALISDLSDEDWDAAIALNLDTMFFCTRAVVRIMIAQGWGGSIVNTSSAAARATLPLLTAYSVAKAGMNQFTRCMAAELAPHNIRVNCMQLGAFDNTGKTLDKVMGREGYLEDVLKGIPLHRFGQVGDASAAALFYASDASSFVTGTVLPIDGGAAMF